MGFSDGSGGKESACNAGDLGWIPNWKIPWRREWQLTPVFLPRESHGQRGLMGYSPWGQTRLTNALTFFQIMGRYILLLERKESFMSLITNILTRQI